MLPKRACLSKSKDVRQTIRNGEQRIKGPLFSLVVRENDLEQSRLAIVVTRKTGKSVIRNRIKRIFRAAFREIYCNIGKKIDLVAFPSSGCKDVKTGKIVAELSKILKLRQEHDSLY